MALRGLCESIGTSFQFWKYFHRKLNPSEWFIDIMSAVLFGLFYRNQHNNAQIISTSIFLIFISFPADGFILKHGSFLFSVSMLNKSHQKDAIN